MTFRPLCSRWVKSWSNLAEWGVRLIEVNKETSSKQWKSAALPAMSHSSSLQEPSEKVYCCTVRMILMYCRNWNWKDWVLGAIFVLYTHQVMLSPPRATLFPYPSSKWPNLFIGGRFCDHNFEKFQVQGKDTVYCCYACMYRCYSQNVSSVRTWNL